MTYNSKLTALHDGLRPIYPDQDRINFAPKLAEDIRILLDETDSDGNPTYLTFNKVRNDGTVWVVSEIEGWWNLSDSSIPDIERGFADGSFDVTGRFLARDITLNGSVLITSGDRSTIASLSATARNELLTAFNLVKRASWLIVDEDEFKRACYVRLSGRPQISTVNSRGRIDFSIGLRASDPIKYEWVDEIPEELISEGAIVINGNGYQFDSIAPAATTSGSRTYLYNAETSDDSYRTYQYDSTTPANSFREYEGVSGVSLANNTGSAVIVNNGNSNVECLFRIVGPLYGPAIIRNDDTGQEINILASTNGDPIISSNTTYLDIDTRTREVVLGTYASGAASTSSRGLLEPLVDWIYLQPGANTIYYNDFGTQTAETASTLQVYWRSGWIG